MAISHAEFARQAAYVASRAASWAGDSLVLPEDHDRPLNDYAVERFTKMLRETADMIEQMHTEGRP